MAIEQFVDERIVTVQGRGNLAFALVVSADPRAVEKFRRMNESRQCSRHFFAIVKRASATELALHLINQNDFGQTWIGRRQCNGPALRLAVGFLYSREKTRAAQCHVS